MNLEQAMQILAYRDQPQLADQDMTATQGFEDPRRSIIWIEAWQCKHCLQRFGEKGRQSGQMRILTANGPEEWCQECVEKGEREGICCRFKKISKADKKKVRKEKAKIYHFLKQQKKEVEQHAKAQL